MRIMIWNDQETAVKTWLIFHKQQLVEKQWISWVSILWICFLSKGTFFGSETAKYLTGPRHLRQSAIFFCLVLSGSESQSQEPQSKKKTLLRFLKDTASSHDPMVFTLINVLLCCGFRVVIFCMLFLKCKHRRKAVKCKTNFYQQVFQLKYDQCLLGHIWVLMCNATFLSEQRNLTYGFNLEKMESKNGNVVYSSVKLWGT